MRSQLILLLLSAVCANAATFNYGFDFVGYANDYAFDCLKSHNYETPFIRVYQKDNRGEIDAYAVGNYRKAAARSMPTELFAELDPVSNKTAGQQIQEIVNYVRANMYDLPGLWIKVVDTTAWTSDVGYNFRFIQDATKAIHAQGIRAGIHTNFMDWSMITGGSNTNMEAEMIWYQSNSGVGGEGQSYSNYNDWRPFANFTDPMVKQYGVAIVECTLLINRNCYQP